uniref:Uncharacterized protein n=1 Tax=Oryza punctata TaxID=4537 RepID=A0A0E0MM66_ORYPU
MRSGGRVEEIRMRRGWVSGFSDAISKVGEVFRQLFTEYTNQVTETENGNQSNGMEQTNRVNEMDVDTSTTSSYVS